MKYKVGDRVRIRKDLVVNEEYNMEGCRHCNSFVGEMAVAKGRCATISDAHKYGYGLHEFCYWWTDEMFEGLAKFKDFTKQDLQDGDYVTDRNGYVYIVSIKFDKFIDRDRKYMPIYKYDKSLNMTADTCKEYDIMKVERNGGVIWEREEKSEKEVQIDELQAQMDEIKRKIDKLRE